MKQIYKIFTGYNPTEQKNAFWKECEENQIVNLIAVKKRLYSSIEWDCYTLSKYLKINSYTKCNFLEKIQKLYNEYVDKVSIPNKQRRVLMSYASGCIYVKNADVESMIEQFTKIFDDMLESSCLDVTSLDERIKRTPKKVLQALGFTKIPKIVFINGYSGENSKKPQVLSELLGLKIEFISVDYDKLNDEIYKSIVNRTKKADIVIGSSTGSYLGRKICEEYNITLISFNPVIDIEETFRKMNVVAPKLPKPEFTLLEEFILVSDDDELIDYKYTVKKFPNQVEVFSGGGHRFTNIEQTIPYLQKSIRSKAR